jgi:hypothetical protein
MSKTANVVQEETALKNIYNSMIADATDTEAKVYI